MSTLSLRFADNDNGIDAELGFGETVTKKFLIENTGTAEASLSLDWNNMINTYLNDSLTFRLTYSAEEDGVYEEVLPSSNIPTSSTPLTQTMVSELSVPVGETYYYNLEITLNNLPEVDQSDDIDAIFTTSFDVGQPLKYRYYKLRVDPNGGSWGEFTSPQEYLLKNEETKEIENPTRAGYTFSGWDLKVVSSSIEDNLFTMGISDAELVARWNVNKYQLTIDANGGTTTTGSKTVTYDSTYGTLPTPTYSGYEFLGWFTATSGGTKVASSTKVSITGNQTLYAHWKKKDPAKETLATLNITSNGVKNGFDDPATTDEGIFEMEDDYGTSITIEEQ